MRSTVYGDNLCAVCPTSLHAAICTRSVPHVLYGGNLCAVCPTSLYAAICTRSVPRALHALSQSALLHLCTWPSARALPISSPTSLHVAICTRSVPYLMLCTRFTRALSNQLTLSHGSPHTHSCRRLYVCPPSQFSCLPSLSNLIGVWPREPPLHVDLLSRWDTPQTDACAGKRTTPTGFPFNRLGTAHSSALQLHLSLLLVPAHASAHAALVQRAARLVLCTHLESRRRLTTCGDAAAAANATAATTATAAAASLSRCAVTSASALDSAVTGAATASPAAAVSNAAVSSEVSSAATAPAAVASAIAGSPTALAPPPSTTSFARAQGRSPSGCPVPTSSFVALSVALIVRSHPPWAAALWLCHSFL